MAVTLGFLVAAFSTAAVRTGGKIALSGTAGIVALVAVEAIVRSPLALATLLEAAGPAAEEQVGRIRVRHQQT